MKRDKKSKNLKRVVLYLFLFSILMILIPEVYNTATNKEFKFQYKVLYFIPVLFLNTLPVVVTLKKNFFIKDGALKPIILIMYYMIFIPIIQVLGGSDILKSENLLMFKLITGTNILLLFYNLWILFKYSFIDVLLRRREIVPMDLIVTFLTYIAVGVSYGFIYVVISIYSDTEALKGINYAGGKLALYFQHIYYSFITLTTAGYGDIVPVSFLARFVTVVEILTGIVLLNISLGITLSSGIEFTKKKK